MSVGDEVFEVARNRGDQPKTIAGKRSPLELLTTVVTDQSLPGVGTRDPWRP